MSLRVLCSILAFYMAHAFSLQDLPVDILDKVVGEDPHPSVVLDMARDARNFHQLTRRKYGKYIDMVHQHPRCIFQYLALDTTKDSNSIRKTFEFFSQVRSVEWLSDKLRTPCIVNDQESQPLWLAVSVDNAAFIKELSDFTCLSIDETRQIEARIGANRKQMPKIRLFLRHSHIMGAFMNTLTDYEKYRDYIQTASLNVPAKLMINKTMQWTYPLQRALTKFHVFNARGMIGAGAKLRCKDMHDHPLQHYVHQLPRHEQILIDQSIDNRASSGYFT